MTKDVDAEVEIYVEDVIEYIEKYATADELGEISEALGYPAHEIDSNPADGSYVEEEKFILLGLAAKKYTLEELEQRLGGNKFDLI